MDGYRGPAGLADDIEEALRVLADKLPVKITACESHSLLECDTNALSAEVLDAIAVYLVGAVAFCVDHHLAVRAGLFGEASEARELLVDVHDVIGQDNSISEHRRTTERDPWLWEAICHLLFHLSHFDPQKHPPERVIAKTCVHLSVKDHGLDLVALYGTNDLGISAGECKAYLTRPPEAVADSSRTLSEVDGLGRDAEIRQAIGQFRTGLSPEVQAKLTGTFWKNERAYFPMVCCDSSCEMDWRRRRDVLERLSRPTDRKFLVPFPIESARAFFDAIADIMREYCSLGEA